ncbi:MAG: TIM barrel protein [bacterium]
MKYSTRRAVIMAIILLPLALGCIAEAADGETKPESVLACRLANYGKYQEAAWTHLPSIGIQYVFLNVPAPDQVEATQKKLAEHGLTAVVLRGDTDLSQESSIGEMAVQLETCEKMGVKYMFLSPKRHGAEKEVIYERLRQVGDVAQRHGVIIALETHPDLGTNGDVHLETMKQINHPNIRVNFDTANIHFYNKDTDAPTELRKIIDYVATVEVKDHDGKFESWYFPALGKGVVKIPEVLQILKEHGYTGPITMEIEGIKGVEWDEEETKKVIADSAAYMRSLETPSTLGKVRGPDYFMLIGYFVLMLGIGVYFYRFMRGMKDYFSGGNEIPWWLSGASFFMSSFSVFAFVSYSALAFKYGWVAVTLYWVTVPATIFSVVLFAKKWRRARIDSPVEYLETRYSASLRQLFAWQGIPVIMVDDGLKLVAIGKFISVGLGLPMTTSMLAAGLIMLAYTFMGGLWAVAVTDFIQFVVMAVAILIILPLSIAKAGGIGVLFQDASFFNLVNSEYNWIYVVLLMLLYALAWSSVKWPLIQRYYCVRDEREAQKVGWFVVVLNIIGPPLMFIPAMAAAHFLGDIPDVDVYPRLCVLLLPAGMLGLVIAAMFSATMSMLSSDYNACAGVLTNDIYRRLIRPDASEKKLVLVGRLMTLLVGLFALGVAFLLSGGSGEGLFRTMVTLFGIATAPVAVPMIMGLLSKKVTNLSAIIGFICGLSTGLFLYFQFYHWLPKDQQTEFLGMVWDPSKNELLLGTLCLKMEVVLFAANALITWIVMLVVSSLKPMGAREREQAKLFHERLGTPIGQMEEDHRVAGEIFSPFFVVGISVLLIGLMMLGVLPWIGDSLAFSLDLFLSIILIIIGGVMTWRSRSSTSKGGTTA